MNFFKTDEMLYGPSVTMVNMNLIVFGQKVKLVVVLFLIRGRKMTFAAFLRNGPVAYTRRPRPRIKFC